MLVVAKTQCKGIKKDGDQCSRMVDGDYCYQHQPEGQGNASNKVNATKEKAAAMLADPTIRTKKEVWKTCNIDESTLYRWLNDQEFIDKINSKIDKYTDRELSEVWKSLIYNATVERDTKAIKLFFEMKGKYKQDIDLSVNQLPDINLVRGVGDE